MSLQFGKLSSFFSFISGFLVKIRLNSALFFAFLKASKKILSSGFLKIKTGSELSIPTTDKSSKSISGLFKFGA